jgi:hypothetical protein
MNSTPHRLAKPLAVFLAGLQAGMIGIGWMLAWLGLSAMGQRRTFWTAENLMASVFHGDAAIRRGFGVSTLSGIALYLLIYSLLGAAFALSVRHRFTGLGTVLLGLLFSLGWYWLWFRALGRTAMPLLWLLHPENTTVFGHVIFGASIARFPAYLPKPDQPVAATPGEEPPVPHAPAPEPAAEPVPPDRDLS